LFNPWLEVVAIGGLFGLGFWAGWRVKPTLGAAVVAGTATALSAVAGAVAASPIVVMLGWEIADDRVIWLLSLVGLASLIGASAGLAGFGACRLLSHRSLAT
jgi:hypothetical protein